MRHIVRDILSKETEEAIRSGSLELILTCRDPNLSRGSSVLATTSDMVWTTPEAKNDLEYSIVHDSGMSLLEWKLVPVDVFGLK